MNAAEEREHVEITSREQWRTWLGEHHQHSVGVWCVTWKKVHGNRYVPYEHVVLECLAVGWVDSIPRKVDNDRSRLLCTPRKPTSGWSRPNKNRIAQLEAEGLMRPAGRAAVATAMANGAWSMLDEVEDLIVPADLAAAFSQHPGSAEQWETLSRSVRRGNLEWIVQAKTAPTRQDRVRRTAARASNNDASH